MNNSHRASNCPSVETFLSSSAFFQGLPDAALQEVIHRFRIRQHLAQELLVIEEDWGSCVYFIFEGWAKICSHNYEGKEVTLNILGPGEIFGEMALLLSSPRSTDVLSLTQLTVGCLPAADFMDLVQGQAAFGFQLAQLMARRLHQLNRRVRMRESDSVARVVDILLFLAESLGKSGAAGIEIPRLSHQEIASLSGLTRETVSRVLSKLDKKNLVKRSKEQIVCLLDFQALENYLG